MKHFMDLENDLQRRIKEDTKLDHGQKTEVGDWGSSIQQER